MTSSASEFQITLVSNVASSPRNTPATFVTQLARPLTLEGAWEVALIDLTFHHEWYNFHQKCNFAVLMPDRDALPNWENDSFVSPEQPRSFVVRSRVENVGVLRNLSFEHDMIFLHLVDPSPNWKMALGTIDAADYSNIEELVQHVGVTIDHVHQRALTLKGSDRTNAYHVPAGFIEYDQSKHRVSLLPKRNAFMIIAPSNASILRVLGFGTQVRHIGSISGTEYDVLFVPRTSALPNPLVARQRIVVRDISSMFIYSDIVEQSLIGDSQGNLLGVMPVTTRYGDQGYWNFNPPFYLPVRFPHLPTIEIRLCQDTGEAMPIEDGRTMCRLHFRRAARYR